MKEKVPLSIMRKITGMISNKVQKPNAEKLVWEGFPGDKYRLYID